jgi:alpha-galactosidase
MVSFLVPAALALDNGLGRTPARGWNAWNSIRCEGLNENLIREVADAMVCQP